MMVAALFALGLAKPFARHFYPGSPGLLPRLAAPLIFGGMAASCFLGVGREVLVFTVLAGLVLIAVTRWRRRGGKKTVGPRVGR